MAGGEFDLGKICLKIGGGLKSKPASLALAGVHGHRCFIKLKIISTVITRIGFSTWDFNISQKHLGNMYKEKCIRQLDERLYLCG